jgi:hypothetical protein
MRIDSLQTSGQKPLSLSLSLSLSLARQRKKEEKNPTLTESCLLVYKSFFYHLIPVNLFLQQNLSLSICKQPLHIEGIFDELRAPSKQLIIVVHVRISWFGFLSIFNLNI